MSSEPEEPGQRNRSQVESQPQTQLPEVILSIPPDALDHPPKNDCISSTNSLHSNRPSSSSLHQQYLTDVTLSSSVNVLPLSRQSSQKSSTGSTGSNGKQMTRSKIFKSRSISHKSKVYSSDQIQGSIPRRPVSFRETSSYKKHPAAKSASNDSTKSMVSFSLEDPSDRRRSSSQQHPRLVRQQTGSGLESTSRIHVSRMSTMTSMPASLGSVSRSTPNLQSTDVETLLTYTKCFLIAAYFVFLCGSGITLNELISFLIDPENSSGSQREDSKWVAGIILLFLAAISLVGLYGALKEESCILMIYGAVILIIFVVHVVLLFHLKNICSQTQKRCYRNMATPPGLAPILVAISELAIAMCAFFMVLVIESERKMSGNNPVFNQQQKQQLASSARSTRSSS